MTIGFFVVTILLIALLGGMIVFLKWALDNMEFSENPKTAQIEKIVVKVAIVFFSGVLAFVLFETALILLAPLFERLNFAFNVAIQKVFEFLDSIIPFAVLGGIGYFVWREKHLKPIIINGGTDPVEVEYAKQEAAELHDDLGELIFNAVVDTSENSPLIRPRDASSIETGREKPYSMDGIMAVHQFSVDTDTPLDKASEDLVLRELQRHANQRAKRYKHLCKDGLAPIIYDVKNNGNFIVVEVVLYSEKYKDKIEARRKARIARQQNQGDTYDRDF